MVMHDAGRTPKVGDPKRRRSDQMPCPPGIGHDVDDAGAAGGRPETVDVGNQTEERSEPSDRCYPSRVVRRVCLDEQYVAAFAGEQMSELTRLIRHASRRRRKRPDEGNRTRY